MKIIRIFSNYFSNKFELYFLCSAKTMLSTILSFLKVIVLSFSQSLPLSQKNKPV